MCYGSRPEAGPVKLQCGGGMRTGPFPCKWVGDAGRGTPAGLLGGPSLADDRQEPGG